MVDNKNTNVANNCNTETKYYNFGLNFDYCDMSLDDVLATQYQNISSGNGGNSNKAVNEVTISKNANNHIILTTSAPTNVDVHVSLSVNGTTYNFTIPENSEILDTNIILTESYATISNIGFTSDDEIYQYKAKNEIDDGIYKLTYKLDDANIYKTYNIQCGSNIITPNNPTKIGYTFVKWSGTFTTMPNEDVIRVAEWNVNKYTLLISDSTSSTTINNVNYGSTLETVIPTEFKDRTGYKRTSSYTGVTMPASNLSITLTYTPLNYNVSFYHENNTTLLQSKNYSYGSMPIYNGTTPTKRDENNIGYEYTFLGWQPNIESVSGQTRYVAKFSEKKDRRYTVYFNVNGVIRETYTNVKYSQISSDLFNMSTTDVLSLLDISNEEVVKFSATTSDLSYQTTNSAYTFNKWSSVVWDTTKMTATYTALFDSETRKYTVSFYSDNVLLKQIQVPYNSVAKYEGATPTKAQDERNVYTFSGWYPLIGKITEDTRFNAVYNTKLRQYLVKFLNYDGTLLKENYLEYGITPSYNLTPNKPSTESKTYTFTGWDYELESVIADVTYTAQYRENDREYEIIFKNGNNNPILIVNKKYGTLPMYSGETPTKTNTAQYTYTFANSWTPEITNVNENKVYTANFTATINKYYVTFVQDDDTVILSTQYEYGETPTCSDPTKDSTVRYFYTFIGWDKEITPVVGTTTYKAIYQANEIQYLVQFINKDVNGSILNTLYSEYAPYGKIVKYPYATPTIDNPGYTYQLYGWDPTIVSITGNTNYYTNYWRTPKTFTYKFTANGVTVTKDITYNDIEGNYPDDSLFNTPDEYTIEWVPNYTNSNMPAQNTSLNGNIVPKDIKIYVAPVISTGIDSFTSIANTTMIECSTSTATDFNISIPVTNDLLDDDATDAELTTWKDNHTYYLSIFIPSDKSSLATLFNAANSVVSITQIGTTTYSGKTFNIYKTELGTPYSGQQIDTTTGEQSAKVVPFKITFA